MSPAFTFERRVACRLYGGWMTSRPFTGADCLIPLRRFIRYLWFRNRELINHDAHFPYQGNRCVNERLSFAVCLFIRLIMFPAQCDQLHRSKFEEFHIGFTNGVYFRRRLLAFTNVTCWIAALSCRSRRKPAFWCRGLRLCDSSFA